MVLAKGLRSQSRYCWAGTDKVASRAVSALEGRDLTAFVVSFASAMRQLECKSCVSPRFPFPRKKAVSPKIFFRNPTRKRGILLLVPRLRFGL